MQRNSVKKGSLRIIVSICLEKFNECLFEYNDICFSILCFVPNICYETFILYIMPFIFVTIKLDLCTLFLKGVRIHIFLLAN